MNVFVLSTGRCGSTTFAQACEHVTNFTSAQESRVRMLGKQRFDYPDNHIEIDNRLVWFLGRLDRHYGDNAFYVHLTRNASDTANSFVGRFAAGNIFKAYYEGILCDGAHVRDRYSVALDMCDTVNSNIELFVRDKSRTIRCSLENALHDFRQFWDMIGAEGDIDAALAELEVCHNASKSEPKKVKRILRKAKNVVATLPQYLKNV